MVFNLQLSCMEIYMLNKISFVEWGIKNGINHIVIPTNPSSSLSGSIMRTSHMCHFNKSSKCAITFSKAAATDLMVPFFPHEQVELMMSNPLYSKIMRYMYSEKSICQIHQVCYNNVRPGFTEITITSNFPFF